MDTRSSRLTEPWPCFIGPRCTMRGTHNALSLDCPPSPFASNLRREADGRNRK